MSTNYSTEVESPTVLTRARRVRREAGWAAVVLLLALTTTAGAEELFIRANQVGYGPADRKIGIVFRNPPFRHHSR